MPEKFAKQIVACNIVTAVMLFVVGGGVGGALLLGYARGENGAAPVASVLPAETVAKTASAPVLPTAAPLVKPFCALQTLVDAPGSVKGWERYQDDTDCFSIEYPQGWKLDENKASLHLWSSGKGLDEGEIYWTADVVVQRPVRDEDGKAVYADLVQKGWVGDGGIMLASPWTPITAGDGSVLRDTAREWAVFTGRGVFRLMAVHRDSGKISEHELEQVISTFKAQ